MKKKNIPGITPTDAAKKSGFSIATIRRRIIDGEIKIIKQVGNTCLIDPASLKKIKLKKVGRKGHAKTKVKNK